MIFCQQIPLCALPSIQLDSDMFSNMFNIIPIVFWLGLMIFYGFSMVVGGFGRKSWIDREMWDLSLELTAESEIWDPKIDSENLKNRDFSPFFVKSKWVQICFLYTFKHFYAYLLCFSYFSTSPAVTNWDWLLVGVALVKRMRFRDFSWFFTDNSHYGHSHPFSWTQMCFLMYLTSFLWCFGWVWWFLMAFDGRWRVW